MTPSKRILVLALDRRVEALRVATGLTLSDATLQVAVWGRKPDDDAARVQLEALEFAEVPVDELPAGGPEALAEMARRIVDADIVYCL